MSLSLKSYSKCQNSALHLFSSYFYNLVSWPRDNLDGLLNITYICCLILDLNLLAKNLT